MNENGRSTKAYFITTRDETRAAYWLRVFGLERLPVMEKRPRWQALDSGRETFAYDLKLSALNPNQLNRFAAVIATRHGVRYDSAKRELQAMTSWPVAAIGCTVEIEELAESEEATAEKRPSLLRWARGVVSYSDKDAVTNQSGLIKKNFRFFRFLSKYA